MRWRPCSPDPMRRMRAAPHSRVPGAAAHGAGVSLRPLQGPRPCKRAPAAQGFQTRRAWQRGRPPAGSGQPVPRGMGLSQKAPRQTTGNRPSNEAQTASFKGRFALWFPFFVRAATAFSFAGAPGDAMRLREPRLSPKRGKRSEPGQSAPAPRPLSIPRFFLSPSAPPESKPRGAHAATEASSPAPASAAGLVTPVTGGPFVLSTVLITVNPDVSSPSMLRRISAPPATKRSPSP